MAGEAFAKEVSEMVDGSARISQDPEPRKNNRVHPVLKLLYKKRWAYYFIAPATILFCIFTVIPVIRSFILAFQEFRLMGNVWVGLENFKYVLTDPVFHRAMRNTAFYTVVMVPQGVLKALILASILRNLPEAVQTFFRGAYYLPGVASAVVISMVWKWIYDPNFGLFNFILGTFGFGPYPWLTSPKTSLTSIMLMGILTAPGYYIILYLAAMKKIPRELYEVADIDGATPFAKWWNVTLPLLKPTTLYITITSIIGSFQIFTSAYVMTQGGPGYSTMTVVYLIYNTAFRDFEFGLASAQAIVLAAIIVFISVYNFRVFSTDVQY